LSLSTGRFYAASRRGATNKNGLIVNRKVPSNKDVKRVSARLAQLSIVPNDETRKLTDALGREAAMLRIALHTRFPDGLYISPWSLERHAS
jgi:hypothetical protein